MLSVPWRGSSCLMACHLYIHLSWTTLDRRPMIGPSAQRFLRRFLSAEAQKLGVMVLSTGIVSDHVHLLLVPPPRWDMPHLVQVLKGASSRIANKDPAISRTGLRWAVGYDARTVSPSAVERVRAYVRDQARRHPDRAAGV